MKVLIAGGGAFRESLIDRLKREKHDVYTISTTAKATHGTINYDFSYADKKLKFVIDNVRPDAVIFLGAMDSHFDFTDEQIGASEYLTGLSNILISSSLLGIERFIYLSSSEVYGTHHNTTLTEGHEKNPLGVKSFIVSEGEHLCTSMGQASKMKCVVLRFAHVYGLVMEKGDFCADIFHEFKQASVQGRPAPAPKREAALSPTYISDAIDGVYRVLTAKDDGDGVYNVSGANTNLSYIYEKIEKVAYFPLSVVHRKPADRMGTAAIPVELETSLPPVDLSVDSSLFRDTYGYRPIIGIDNGLERLERGVHKWYTQHANDKKERKIIHLPKFFSLMLPLLENFIVFGAFAFLHLLLQDTVAGTFDFMILYVVIIGMSFGLLQASVAILLASVFTLVMGAGGANVFESLIGYDYMVIVLQFLILGTICGYVRDNTRTTVSESKAALSDAHNELEAIHKINDANITIKRTLDERLTSYGDSLAKIYSIIESLNTLQPDQLFFESVKVVMDVMNCGDVSIYVVTGDSFKMCRLMAKTPTSSRVLKQSIPLKDLPALAKSIERDEVFVNRDLTEELPVMAAPVFSAGKLVSVIMLWDIGFEKLTLYNVNRFAVLSKLISSVLEKANAHAQSMREASLIEGTDILVAKAFEEILNSYRQAKETTSFQIILVGGKNPETGEALTIYEISPKLQALLRVNDYMGQNTESNSSVYVLLSNTTTENLPFVRERLEKAGLSVEGAAL